MTPGRRKVKCPDLKVQMRILEELHEKGEHYPTNLAGSSNVSYKMLKKCLFVLHKNSLVSITKTEDCHDIIKITIAGIELLDIYKRYIAKLLDDL
jgi:predicted transcriptional regulator